MCIAKDLRGRTSDVRVTIRRNYLKSLNMGYTLHIYGSSPIQNPLSWWISDPVQSKSDWTGLDYGSSGLVQSIPYSGRRYSSSGQKWSAVISGDQRSVSGDQQWSGVSAVVRCVSSDQRSVSSGQHFSSNQRSVSGDQRRQVRQSTDSRPPAPPAASTPFPSISAGGSASGRPSVRTKVSPYSQQIRPYDDPESGLEV